MPGFHAFFRELFQTFLGDFLRIAEPDFAVHLLPERARVPVLDLAGWSDEERATLGAVADVPAVDGSSVTVLIHSEPEPLDPVAAWRRLGRYFVGLEMRYSQPVVLTAVYLRGGRPGLNLESATLSRVFEVETVRFFYNAFGLEECRAEHYLERPEPLAWALAGLMRPVRRGRAEHRRACLRRIAEAGLPDRETALLRTCIEEWMPEPRDIFSVDISGPGLPGRGVPAVQGSPGKRRSER